MKISVFAKPKSSKEFIEKTDEKNFVVAVRESATDGRANMAICKALAKYFKVSFSQVMIVSGATSRHKIIEIDE